MRTARLRPIATRYQHQWGWGSEVNKFKQDGHQMSLAVRSHVQREGGWRLYSEVQCIMDNGHMGTLRHGQTD